jgi:hypothetical protein
MTLPILTADDRAHLDRAISLLDLVGKHADNETSGLAAVHALRAADLLEVAGATVRPLKMQLSKPDVRAAVRHALRSLSLLSSGVFDHPAVADATEAAQRAFAAS